MKNALNGKQIRDLCLEIGKDELRNVVSAAANTRYFPADWFNGNKRLLLDFLRSEGGAKILRILRDAVSHA